MTQRDYNVNPIISYDPITKSEGISIPSPVYHTMMRLTATPRATKFDGLTFFFITPAEPSNTAVSTLTVIDMCLLFRYR